LRYRIRAKRCPPKGLPSRQFVQSIELGHFKIQLRQLGLNTDHTDHTRLRNLIDRCSRVQRAPARSALFKVTQEDAIRPAAPAQISTPDSRNSPKVIFSARDSRS
jgi:hypothetical protein